MNTIHKNGVVSWLAQNRFYLPNWNAGSAFQSIKLIVSNNKTVCLLALGVSTSLVLARFALTKVNSSTAFTFSSLVLPFFKSLIPLKFKNIGPVHGDASVPAPVSPLLYQPEEGRPSEQAATLSPSPTVAVGGGIPNVDLDLVREIVKSLLSRRSSGSDARHSTRLYDTKLAEFRLGQISASKSDRKTLLVEGPVGAGQQMAVAALVERESATRPVIHIRLMDLVDQIQAASQSPSAENRRISINESQMKLLRIKQTDSAFARSNESFYTGDLNSPSQVFSNPFLSKSESNASNIAPLSTTSAWSSQSSLASVESPTENLADIFRTTVLRSMGIPESKLVAKLTGKKPLEELDWLLHVKTALKHVSTLIPKPPLVVIEDLEVLFHPVSVQQALWTIQPIYKLVPQQQYAYVSRFDPFSAGSDDSKDSFVSQKDVEPLLLFLLDLQHKQLLDVVFSSSFFGILDDNARTRLVNLQKVHFANPVLDVLTFNRIDEASFDSVWEETVYPLLAKGDDVSVLSFDYLFRSDIREKWLQQTGTDLSLVQLYIDCYQRAGDKKPTLAEFFTMYQQHMTKFLDGTVLSSAVPTHDHMYWESLQAFTLEMIMKGGVLNCEEVSLTEDLLLKSPLIPASSTSATLSLSEMARRKAIVKELCWWGFLTIHSDSFDSIIKPECRKATRNVQWSSKFVGSIFESWFNSVPVA